MRILILGGTLFLGRHLVEVGLSRGHELTLFNRGRTNPELFPELEQLRGDRDGGLAPLSGRQFDTVLDTSGYFPRVVRDSAQLLATQAERYVFVSSMSVYASHQEPNQDETAAVAQLEDETVEDGGGGAYGGLKALCEGEVLRSFPQRSLVIRPGLIVGPHDPTDRFSYWVMRMSQPGEVLAPAPGTQTVEFVDVRDLADWIVRCAEDGVSGVMNASGPAPEKISLEGLLATCSEVVGRSDQPMWVEEGFLLEHGVAPWSDLPLWLGSGQAGFATRSAARALEAGLRFRPVAETVRDTLNWRQSEAGPLQAGLSPERESELLAAWRARG